MNLDLLEAILIGNALGRPFNGLKKGHVAQLVGHEFSTYLTDPVIFPDKPDRNCLPGLHDAYAQQLLLTVSTILEDSEMLREPAAVYGASLIELAADEEEGRLGIGLRDPGKPLSRALNNWSRSYPWTTEDYFSDEEDSEGLGGLLLGFSKPVFGHDVSSPLTRFTHARPIAVGAEVYVGILAEELSRNKVKKGTLEDALDAALEQLLEWEESYCESMKKHWREIGWGSPRFLLSHYLKPVKSLVLEGDDRLTERTLTKGVSDTSPRFKATHMQHGFAGMSIPWLTYLACTRESPEAVAEEVINRGGECSRILGALLGLMHIRFGIDRFPDEWRTGLLAGNQIRLLKSYHVTDDVKKLLGEEYRWSLEEKEFREDLRQKLEKKRQKDIAKGKVVEKKKPKKKEEHDFVPPPSYWMGVDDEDELDPKKKKVLKAQRGKKRIGWKEERRKKNQDSG